LVQSLAAGDAKTALEAVDAAVGRGVGEVQLARAIVRFLRDLAVAHAAPGASSLIEGSEEERAEIAEIAEGLEAGRVRQMFDRMLRACEDLGQTQQPRMVLDLALIDVAAIETLVPLGTLMERLSTLEARLRAGGGGGTSAGGGGARSGSRGDGRARSGAQASPTTASPRTDSPMPEPPMTASPMTASPMTASPMPESPTTASPMTASPMTASPMTASPRTASPMPESPTTASPMTASPMTASPTTASPAPGTALAEGSGAHAQPSNPLRAWEAVIGALADAREFGLVTIYQTAKVLSWSEDEVAVGFPADGLTAEIASDKEKVASMKAFLEKRAGHPVSFQVKLLSEDEEAEAVSILEDAKRRADEETEAKRQEAKDHPITKVVLETFDASIKEIRTDV
jgi:DNA polymerase III gamma/tau subunit